MNTRSRSTYAPPHPIAQVFASTLAAGGYGRLHPADADIIAIVRGLQRAAHFGTLLAAAALGKSCVVLTPVGGGVFGNPMNVIWESILWAIDAVRPLLHRDLVVVLNGRNLRRKLSQTAMAEAAAARGGTLFRVDGEKTTRRHAGPE